MYKDIIIKTKTKCDKCDGFEKRAPFSLAQYLDVNTKTDFYRPHTQFVGR